MLLIIIEKKSQSQIKNEKQYKRLYFNPFLTKKKNTSQQKDQSDKH